MTEPSTKVVNSNHCTRVMCASTPKPAGHTATDNIEIFFRCVAKLDLRFRLRRSHYLLQQYNSVDMKFPGSIQYHPRHFESIISMRNLTFASELQQFISATNRMEIQSLRMHSASLPYTIYWSRATRRLENALSKPYANSPLSPHGAPSTMLLRQTSRNNSLLPSSSLSQSTTTSFAFSQMHPILTGHLLLHKYQKRIYLRHSTNRGMNLSVSYQAHFLDHLLIGQFRKKKDMLL